jgi:hypothetical protein
LSESVPFLSLNSEKILYNSSIFENFGCIFVCILLNQKSDKWYNLWQIIT